MTKAEFERVLSKGENLTVEFKTWIHAKNMRERIFLAVDELVAFANAKGGTVYMGVEDDGTVTAMMNRRSWNLFMTGLVQHYLRK